MMAKANGGAGRKTSGHEYGYGVAAENRFRSWLRKQPKAVAEVQKIAAFAANIKSPANKRKYLRNAKHDFDTRWTIEYANRRR